MGVVIGGTGMALKIGFAVVAAHLVLPVAALALGTIAIAAGVGAIAGHFLGNKADKYRALKGAGNAALYAAFALGAGWTFGAGTVTAAVAAAGAVTVAKIAGFIGIKYASKEKRAEKDWLGKKIGHSVLQGLVGGTLGAVISEVGSHLFTHHTHTQQADHKLNNPPLTKQATDPTPHNHQTTGTTENSAQNQIAESQKLADLQDKMFNDVNIRDDIPKGMVMLDHYAFEGRRHIDWVPPQFYHLLLNHNSQAMVFPDTSGGLMVSDSIYFEWLEQLTFSPLCPRVELESLG